jgi:glutamine amidotransferase
MTDVVIVDSGGANLASLRYAFQRLGTRVELASKVGRIESADRVVLPGVGAAPQAMRRLTELGLIEALRGLTQPVLGICLGMQLLFERSEEGEVPCLALIPQPVRKLAFAPGRPVPHMGWNRLGGLLPDPLLTGVTSEQFVYFVHRFAASVGPHTLAQVEYGVPISAVVRMRNFWGVQFHPERSSSVGAQLLANFLRL